MQPPPIPKSGNEPRSSAVGRTTNISTTLVADLQPILAFTLEEIDVTGLNLDPFMRIRISNERLVEFHETAAHSVFAKPTFPLAAQFCSVSRMLTPHLISRWINEPRIDRGLFERFFNAASYGNLGLILVTMAAAEMSEEQREQLNKYQESCLHRRRLLILLEAKGIEAVREAEQAESERLRQVELRSHQPKSVAG